MKYIGGMVSTEFWAEQAAAIIAEMAKKPLADFAAEALEEILHSTECHASLPIAWVANVSPSDGWGGPPQNDPLMVYVNVGLPNDDGKPLFAFSFEECVDDYIECVRPGDGSPLDADECVSAIKLRDSLLKMAAKLDAAMAAK